MTPHARDAGFDVVTVPTLTPATAAWSAALEFLNEADGQRLSHMRGPHDQARFLTGRTELRRLAASWLNVAAADVEITARCGWCGGAHGEPIVRGPDGHRLFASVSHVDCSVTVAVSATSRLGVDVENIDGVRFSGFDLEVLTSTEGRWLTSYPSARRAWLRARIWTVKEAVLKAAGVGLTMPLADVEISEPWTTRTSARIHSDGDQPVFDVHAVDVPAGYTGHVALLPGLSSPNPQVDPEG